MRFFLLLFLVSMSFSVSAQEQYVWLDKEYAQLTDSTAASYFYQPKRVKTVTSGEDTMKIYVIHNLNGALHRVGGYESTPDSKKWGRHTLYSSKGRKIGEGAYIGGVRRGKWMYWYGDGRLKYEMDFEGLYSYKALEYADSTGIFRTSGGQGVFSFCFETYCESGRVVDGYKEGRWQIFDDEGVTHEEIYRGGQLVSGRWLKGNGIITYNDIESPAHYTDGGLTGFYKLIANNMQYPDYARKRGIEGKVYVQFVVDKEGSLTDLEVVQSPDASFSKEALRVMASVGSWAPARYRGQPVKQRIVAPLVFMLD